MRADQNNSAMIVLPELCINFLYLWRSVFSESLVESAKSALIELSEKTKHLKIIQLLVYQYYSTILSIIVQRLFKTVTF